MLELANQAGGDPPAPAKPNTVHLETARNLTGNEQLMELFNSQDRLKKEIAEWKATKSTLEARLPRWKTLEKLLEYADGLDAHDRLVEQVQAIEASRSLTSDPDPVPPLSQEVSAALREKLSAAYSAYNEAYHRLNSELTSSETWQQLPGDEAKYIRQQNSLKVFEEPLMGTEDALLSALSSMSFSELESQTAALPGRTQQARLDAEKHLEPRSVQLKHPGVTLKTEAEVDEYLADLREEIMRHIDDGSPVVL